MVNGLLWQLQGAIITVGHCKPLHHTPAISGKWLRRGCAAQIRARWETGKPISKLQGNVDFLRLIYRLLESSSDLIPLPPLSWGIILVGTNSTHPLPQSLRPNQVTLNGFFPPPSCYLKELKNHTPTPVVLMTPSTTLKVHLPGYLSMSAWAQCHLWDGHLPTAMLVLWDIHIPWTQLDLAQGSHMLSGWDTGSQSWGQQTYSSRAEAANFLFDWQIIIVCIYGAQCDCSDCSGYTHTMWHD